MDKKIKISASILSADFTNLKSEIKKCEAAGVDMIHLDVMDGHFVPNITIGPVLLEAIRPLTRLPLDAHLMIENPGMYIDKFIDAGADIITLHAECYGKLTAASSGLGKFPKELEKFDARLAEQDIKRIKARGKKAALTLNPGTPLCIQDCLGELDLVLIMSVNPGFAGQKFMPSVLPKISALKKIFAKDIEVDGGINEETAQEVVKAGANILATASCFFKSDNPQELIARLKSLNK
ncbi:MAG: ribulose-phosphate 3-epimerase [Candidatus Omnitrophota bacterium]|nr:ribulose-phosphate 3-epimerase [Candidatus Omnitrophota bacterium]